MKKNGFGGAGGMGGMSNMLKQAQKMQNDIRTLQAELEKREYSASSGGGVVKATVTGANVITNLEINPEAVDPNDVEMLRDLIMSAVNEALRIADETSSGEMSKVTGGANLSGGLF